MTIQIKYGYLIPDNNLTGPEQMALDEYLLNESFEKNYSSPFFRLSRWKGTWLSIGRNQLNIPNKWNELVHQNKLGIIKRPSGGNAVLHKGGITYSIIWPSPPKKKKESYYKSCNWIINCFKDFNFPLVFGNDNNNNHLSNCFNSSSSADLIDKNGYKRVGSAQLWRKGHLLQHGEIILDPPNELWEEVFKSKPPKNAPENIPRKSLDNFLIRSLIDNWFEFEWKVRYLTTNELILIRNKAQNYILGSDSKPSSKTLEAIISSTTFGKAIPKG